MTSLEWSYSRSMITSITTSDTTYLMGYEYWQPLPVILTNHNCTSTRLRWQNYTLQSTNLHLDRYRGSKAYEADNLVDDTQHIPASSWFTFNGTFTQIRLYCAFRRVNYILIYSIINAKACDEMYQLQVTLTMTQWLGQRGTQTARHHAEVCNWWRPSCMLSHGWHASQTQSDRRPTPTR